MAKRPVFIPNINGDTFVKTIEVDFEWFPGMASSQKQKSINSLHANARKQTLERLDNILEVSSKSTNRLGVSLSAFNLSFPYKKRKLTVEVAYQGSKIFQNGGPFIDILDKTSLDAKRDERLKTSGNIKGFTFGKTSWGLEPQTAFYDWLYLNALKLQSDELIEEVLQYSAFTDIEYNPNKSINCQGYSVALYISLYKSKLLDIALESKEAFLDIMNQRYINNARQNDSDQRRLI